MKIKLLVCLLVLLFTLPLTAAPPKGKTSNFAQTIDNTTWIDGNKILMFVTNHGNFGRDLSDYFGYDYGTFYPYAGDPDPISAGNDDAIRSPLYAAGLWVGGRDSVTNDVRVIVAEYNDEYVPGPMVGGTFQADAPEFRTYKLYKDSLWDNPNQEYLDYVANAVANQGAPEPYYIDGNDTISNIIGDQFLWAVYNDADPGQHTNNSGETAPMGLEVRQSTFAFNREDALGEIVFLRWRVFNKGSNTLQNCYFSVWSDPDLGGSGDDLVGIDTTLSLGYCYNANNNDQYYGSTPPAIGFDFFQGPKVFTGDDADTAKEFGQLWPQYKTLPAASFNKYINGTDPDDFNETYNYMLGLNPDGSQYEYEGTATTFQVSGDPVAGTGDLDIAPNDRRMMISTGPITFRPGDSTEIVAAIVVAMGGDRLSSIGKLKYQDEFAQQAYDNDFVVPDPPASPIVTVAEQDQQFVLTWTDTSEVNHGTYDFQGYTIYQGTSSNGPWTRIANYDVNDGVALILDDVYNVDVGSLENVVVKKGSDNGLSHYYVIDQDKLIGGDLANVTEYYFRVEAYSYNATGVPKTLTSANKTPISVRPHAPLAGLTSQYEALDTLFATHTAGGSNGTVYALVLKPFELTGHDYRVTFDTTDAGEYYWNLTDVTTGTMLLTGQTNQSGDDNYTVVDGMVIKALGPAFGVVAIDEVADASGPITPDNVMFSLNSTADWYVSSDAGSDFSRMNWLGEIGTYDWEFRFTSGGSQFYDFWEDTLNTVRAPFEVWNIGIGTPDDTTDDVRIEFAAIDDDNSLSWSYGDRIYPDETPYTEPLPATPNYGTWRIGRIIFNDYSGATTQPAEGTIVRFTTAKINTPNDIFEFSAEAPTLTKAEDELNDIKAVPNPFYLYDRYDPSPGSKQLAFHHLPTTCTIRIYNLGGDLIRTLDKDDASTPIAFWDMLTDRGLPVASGIYVYVVDAPGYGQKVGKVAVFTETEVLKIY